MSHIKHFHHSVLPALPLDTNQNTGSQDQGSPLGLGSQDGGGAGFTQSHVRSQTDPINCYRIDTRAPARETPWRSGRHPLLRFGLSPAG